VNVLPLAAHCLMRFGEERHRLASAMTPLLAATHPALGRFQRPFRLAIPTR